MMSLAGYSYMTRSSLTSQTLLLGYLQFLPNDEREQERLVFLHQIFRLTLDGELCFTKLDNPERILDIGTGTGIWAIESKSSPVTFIYLTGLNKGVVYQV